MKQEKMLDEEQRMVAALLQLCEGNGLEDVGLTTPAQLQASFYDVDDQAVSGRALGRVLVKVAVARDSSGRFQGWQVRDAEEKLNALADKLREALSRCREDLGR